MILRYNIIYIVLFYQRFLKPKENDDINVRNSFIESFKPFWATVPLVCTVSTLFSLLCAERDKSHDIDIRQCTAVNQTICSVPLHSYSDWRQCIAQFPFHDCLYQHMEIVGVLIIYEQQWSAFSCRLMAGWVHCLLCTTWLSIWQECFKNMGYRILRNIFLISRGEEGEGSMTHTTLEIHTFHILHLLVKP